MIALASLLFRATVTHADDIGARVPPSEGTITDAARALSLADVASLERLVADFERETSRHVFVLTVPSLEGEAIESFSMRVLSAWKLAGAGWDNVILVTLAMREHRICIEMGALLAGHISDAIVTSIIEETMTPALRDGDLAGALRSGLLRLMGEARKYPGRDPLRRNEVTLQFKSDGWTSPLSAATVAISINGHVQDQPNRA